MVMDGKRRFQIYRKSWPKVPGGKVAAESPPRYRFHIGAL
jgi:hypothetical protein